MMITFKKKMEIKRVHKLVLLLVVMLCTMMPSVFAYNDFIYIDESNLESVKGEVNNLHYFFYSAYLDLMDAADDEISNVVNPVTNKTQTPPSGNKHDYLSLAPYWWPNPDTPDGLPWIRKDGKVNPETRGDHTDQVRSSEMFSSVEILALAYYFSGKERYAEKAYQHIHAWFIDEDTKMNPNINYGQAVPGSVEGRAAGIIEFVGVGRLITALQILERDSIFSFQECLTMKQWMRDMVTWLTTHEYALKENNANNNHGSWYDYQVLGMYMYLGDTAKAVAKAESIKSKRIAVQIKSDGSQPEELGRTKSVNYSTMNLRAMTYLCLMAQKVGVDLWNYETSQGASVRRAYEFFVPYIMKTKAWGWEQIVGGGASASLESLTVPLFAKASSIFQETLLPTAKSGTYSLSYIDKLCFPPLDMLVMPQRTALSIAFAHPVQDTVMYVGTMPSRYTFDIATAASLSDIKLWLAVDGVTLRTATGKRQVWQGTEVIEHEDLAALTKGTHELKVVAQHTDGSIAEAHIQVTVEAVSMPYTDTALAIPGIIEAEDYDIGGPEVAYHDSDADNYYGKYRADGVDILQSGALYVSQIVQGEWLNYTVEVSESGWYDFEFSYSASQEGLLGLQWEGADTVLFEHFKLPISSSSATKKRIWLAQGKGILRLNFENTAIFHLDKITFTASTAAYLNTTKVNRFNLYPNPTTGLLYIDKAMDWSVYEITGKMLMRGSGQVIDLSDFPQGIYLVSCPLGLKKVLKH